MAGGVEAAVPHRRLRLPVHRDAVVPEDAVRLGRHSPDATLRDVLLRFTWGRLVRDRDA